MAASRTFLLPSLLVVALTLPACGGGGDSSTDQACAAKDDLSHAIQKVVDDVKAGNLGDATDDLATVRTRAADLKKAVADLSSEERKKVQPQVDSLEQQVQGLRGVTSLTQLQTQVTAISGSASDLLDKVGEDLSCG
jgi:uncharacterized protein (DUF3084 family)